MVHHRLPIIPAFCDKMKTLSYFCRKEAVPYSKRKQLILWYIFVAILFWGLYLRFKACYWGMPYRLHPDEGTIVIRAIDMLSRNSWEAHSFERPDQIEIKICSILFQIVSHIRYGCDAEEAWNQGNIDFFYLTARRFTAVCGTLMIPLGYCIVEKVKSHSGIFAAAGIAFFPIFVEHSAYATPDIPLTLITMLISYTAMLYLEHSTQKRFIFLCIEIGCGILIKYTCAISCILLAIVFIYNEAKQKKKKKIMHIVIAGLCSVICILATIFFLAPNLFTNFNELISHLKTESRNNHLGADGLGFWGNLLFYLKCFTEHAGFETWIFVILGIVWLFFKRTKHVIPLSLGGIFWICTSILSLHWERWGMPMYVTPIFFFAIGISFIIDAVFSLVSIKQKVLYGSIPISLCLLIFMNNFITANVVSLRQSGNQTRIEALSYCNANQITKENSLSDGYTPLRLFEPGSIDIQLDENEKLIIPENIEYLILSSDMYDRYYEETNIYQNVIAKYNAIREQCDLIAEFNPVPEKSSVISIINLPYQCHALKQLLAGGINGCTIEIYHV